jgi:hypothetical protein
VSVVLAAGVELAAQARQPVRDGPDGLGVETHVARLSGGEECDDRAHGSE